MHDAVKAFVGIRPNRKHVAPFSNRVERVLQNRASFLNEVFELANDPPPQIPHLFAKTRELGARGIENRAVIADRHADLFLETVERRVDGTGAMQVRNAVFSLPEKPPKRRGGPQASCGYP